MVLLCNRPDLADELLENMDGIMPAQGLARLARMHGKHSPADMVALHEDAAFMQAVHQVGDVGKSDGELVFTA
jgi:beta-N-acetylhexosaminidase